MNTKDMNEEIQTLINRAENRALFHVEQLARNILRKHPELDEFVIGRGKWYFTLKDINGNGNFWNEESDDMANELQDFISKWEKLRLAIIYPMRFTAEGPKVTKW